MISGEPQAVLSCWRSANGAAAPSGLANFARRRLPAQPAPGPCARGRRDRPSGVGAAEAAGKQEAGRRAPLPPLCTTSARAMHVAYPGCRAPAEHLLSGLRMHQHCCITQTTSRCAASANVTALDSTHVACGTLHPPHRSQTMTSRAHRAASWGALQCLLPLLLAASVVVPAAAEGAPFYVSSFDGGRGRVRGSPRRSLAGTAYCLPTAGQTCHPAATPAQATHQCQSTAAPRSSPSTAAPGGTPALSTPPVPRGAPGELLLAALAAAGAATRS